LGLYGPNKGGPNIGGGTYLPPLCWVVVWGRVYCSILGLIWPQHRGGRNIGGGTYLTPLCWVVVWGISGKLDHIGSVWLYFVPFDCFFALSSKIIHPRQGESRQRIAYFTLSGGKFAVCLLDTAGDSLLTWDSFLSCLWQRKHEYTIIYRRNVSKFLVFDVLVPMISYVFSKETYNLLVFRQT
jgi:hypothetical protein